MSGPKRKCDNWLMAFREWSLPRSEAPESYHLWAGLFTLASVLKRRVKIPKKYLGGWEVSPTLYTIFVAPPGKARKSTTAFYSEELLREIPLVERTATAITKEQLYRKLSEVRDSSLSIFSSEFAIFIQKSGLDMYDTLTDLFDGKRDVSSDQIGRALDFAAKPCVNLLACTTPTWVSENMPEYVIGGGFASRVIFVFEEKSRRHKLLYDDDPEVDWKKIEKLHDDLVTDLAHLATFEGLEGDFEIPVNSKKFLDNENPKNLGWYQQHQKMTEDQNTNSRLSGYFERKPAHVLKVAMLMHLAHSDTLVLELPDIVGALTIFDELEIRLPQTFEQIGKNPYAADIVRMLEFIRRRREVSKRELMANFYQAADPKKLQELIQGLLDMGEVKMYLDKDDPHNAGKCILRYVGSLKAAASKSD